MPPSLELCMHIHTYTIGLWLEREGEWTISTAGASLTCMRLVPIRTVMRKKFLPILIGNSTNHPMVLGVSPSDGPSVLTLP